MEQPALHQQPAFCAVGVCPSKLFQCLSHLKGSPWVASRVLPLFKQCRSQRIEVHLER
jgi:hypothetical protein